MNDFNPKLQFQTYHKAEAEWLMQNINRREAKIAMEAALMERVYRGASQEELKGARDFISSLINLAEIDKPEHFPVKKLVTLGQLESLPQMPDETGSKK